VEKKYLDYTAEEMVDDRNFLIWLSHLSENQELDALVHEHPQFARKVSQAREMILLLKVKEAPVLQDDIYSIWENIVQVDRADQSSLKIRKYHKFIKYAAAVIFVMMLSSLGYWKILSNNKHQVYVFQTNKPIQQSRLILSSGKEIDLKKDESTVKVNAQNNAIRVNNDSIIKLSSNPEDIEKIAMNQVVVPFGKKLSLELADGTKVWLNAGSKMAFPDRFSGSNREVFLEGEAYFDVTPDKNKPFFVKTKEIVVRVLGTKFNLSAYEADREVMTILVEGKVSMRENNGINLFGKEILLNSHQKAVFDKTNLTTTVNQEPNAEIFAAWTDGWFPFSKEPLNNVFKKVERYYNVQFVYNEPFPSTDLISGKLDLKDSIEEVMKVLADVANVTYEIEQDKIFIKHNNQMPMRK